MACVCNCGWRVHTTKAVALACKICGDRIECAGSNRYEKPEVVQQPFDKWPAWAKAVKKFAKSKDTGVGDTAQRIAASFGGEYFKTFAKSIGMPCGCTERQADWNKRYPYTSAELVFVTSLSPATHSRESQLRAVNSWKKFGARVIALNTADEIKLFDKSLPHVEWMESGDVVTWGQDRTSQKVTALLGVAQTVKQPVFLINADIETIGDKHLLVDAMPDERVTLGIRWNYDTDRTTATEFQWGFDVVGVTPQHVARLPANCIYGIGQPVWDYAVPMLMSCGFNVLHERLFFHQSHQQNWCSKAWAEGAELFSQWFGKITNMNTATWRKRFEPEMEYDRKAGRYVHCVGG